MEKNQNLKQTCVYCGNNPVPHHFFWYNESLNIVLTPLRQKLLYNPLTRFIKKRQWDLKLTRIFLYIAEALKIVSRQSDVAKCKVRRAQVLWEEAGKRGIVMQELMFFGKPVDSYIAEKQDLRFKIKDLNKTQTPKYKNQSIIFSGLPRPAGYTNNLLDLMDDKWFFKQMMLDNNLPVPKGGSCSTWKQAKEILKQIQGTRYQVLDTNPDTDLIPSTYNLVPVIVKPRAGSRGRHSTTFIYSEQDLQRAFKIAQQLCHWVMVEEQLMGPVYRATVVNFQLAGVLRGDSPEITGDGKSAIEELIRQKNQQAHLGVKDIIVDKSMEIFLARQNLQLASIPQKDATIKLSEKIGVSYGGSSSEDFDICHPDNKELFVKAAKVLGDPLVGFDFIIADVTRSWKEQKCGFIEVNTLPFINLHHDPLHGAPRNVAAKVWEMLGW